MYFTRNYPHININKPTALQIPKCEWYKITAIVIPSMTIVVILYDIHTLEFAVQLFIVIDKQVDIF